MFKNFLCVYGRAWLCGPSCASPHRSSTVGGITGHELQDTQDIQDVRVLNGSRQYKRVRPKGPHWKLHNFWDGKKET